MESDKLESCLYDARKRKAMCSNRPCSGKYSVFCPAPAPCHGAVKRRGLCPCPVLRRGTGSKGILPTGVFPKGAVGGSFAKGPVPVLTRPVAGGLFSSVSPGGLVPGAGGAGHAQGTGTTAQPGNRHNWTSGAIRTIGTHGKERDNLERDHRGQCPESRVPGCPRYPRYPGSQGIAGAAPGKETWATDWQHRQGNQARCRFEGRDAPVCVPVQGPAESFSPHCMALASRSAAETAGPLECWFPSKRGPILKDTMPDNSVADRLLRSFGVETLSFLVPSPPAPFLSGERADRLVHDAKSPPGLVRWSVVRQTSHVVSARIPGCVLCSGVCRMCPLSGCLGLCKRCRQAETSLWGLWGDVLATCAYLVKESERWSL